MPTSPVAPTAATTNPVSIPELNQKCRLQDASANATVATAASRGRCPRAIQLHSAVSP